MWDWKQVKWVRFFGWWIHDISNGRMKNLARFWGLLTFWILPMDLGMQFSSLCLAIKEGGLRKSLSIIPILAMSTSMTVKTFVWVYRSQEIKAIIDQFEVLNTRRKKLFGRTTYYNSTMVSHTENCGRFALLLPLSFLGGLHWVVRPVFFSLSGEYTTIVDDWVPWDDKELTGWLSHLILTLVVLVIALTGMLTYETLMLSFYEMMIALLKIISSEFSSLDFECGDDLFDCFIMHRDALKLRKDISSLSNIVLQTDTLLYVLILCCGVLEITLDSSPLTKKINMIEACAVFTVFFYLHCYKCQTIITLCSDLSFAAYDNNWYVGRPRDKYMLSLIILRSTKMETFGSIIRIDLQTFLTVVRTSFSYYSALKAFDIH